MKVETAFAGALVLDSYPYSVGGTGDQARALKSTGVDGFVGYLGAMTKARLDFVLGAGLAFMPVTTAADAFKGEATVKRCRDLGLPPQTTVWVDFEGPGVYAEGEKDPLGLIAKLNAALIAIREADFMPGLYVGAPQPLTSEELYSLAAVRYWQGIGQCRDRFRKLAEPTCGWAMRQGYHGIPNGMGMMWKDIDPTKNGRVWKHTNVFVDPNMVHADYRRRFPNWVIP